MKWLLNGLMAFALLAVGALGTWFYGQRAGGHELPTRESVITQIQTLNRLESVAFHIDTIIKTQKQGNWYALWQDAQSGLFLARGTVIAGLDLNRLKPDNVTVANDGKVIISLPPVQILGVNVDKIDVYDIKTGSLGLTPVDKSLFGEVQQMAKHQVLQSACKADILQHAQNQTQAQLETLFALTHTDVSVYPAALPACKASF